MSGRPRISNAVEQQVRNLLGSGMTHVEIAEKCGISKASVARIRDRAPQPTVQDAIDLLDETDRNAVEDHALQMRLFDAN